MCAFHISSGSEVPHFQCFVKSNQCWGSDYISIIDVITAASCVLSRRQGCTTAIKANILRSESRPVDLIKILPLISCYSANWGGKEGTKCCANKGMEEHCHYAIMSGNNAGFRSSSSNPTCSSSSKTIQSPNWIYHSIKLSLCPVMFVKYVSMYLFFYCPIHFVLLSSCMFFCSFF